MNDKSRRLAGLPAWRLKRVLTFIDANIDIPVASIARASGFTTQAHFTSLFRRFVGKPPAHWRRAMTTSL